MCIICCCVGPTQIPQLPGVLEGPQVFLQGLPRDEESCFSKNDALIQRLIKSLLPLP